MSAELRIETPEGVQFTYAIAGPVSRCLAWLVDFAVVLVLLACVGIALGNLRAVSIDLAGALVVVGYFVLWTGYGIFCEWRWRGQTLGKRLFQLRVMDVEGLRLQFHQVLMRNLLRAVDCLPFCYLLGGICSLIDPQSRRLGDLAAATVVVRLPKRMEPDLAQLHAGRFNSFRAYPHLVARLRQRTSAGEAALALEAIVRREEFDDSARLDLFAALASQFRAAVPFPPEAAENLSDEQYVRNVVDAIYSPGTKAGAPRANAAAS